MCYPAKCPRCAKTTWDGCGQHADEVMGSVPPAQRCECAHSTENHRAHR
ncbi:hypothetical protein [Mycolicibacterium alvei]|nr:hypothetical protein [Mycolicibacterium alvei]